MFTCFILLILILILITLSPSFFYKTFCYIVLGRFPFF